MRSLVIVKEGCSEGPAEPGRDIISVADLGAWIRDGRFFRRLFSYRRVEVRCYRLEVLRGPFCHALIIWLLSRGWAVIRDETNRTIQVTPFRLLVWGIRRLRDWAATPLVLTGIKKQVAALEKERIARRKTRCYDGGTPVYLRTDLVFGLRSGGSLGHIAGVLNHLDGFCGKPVFLTTDHIPGVREGVVKKLIRPDHRFIDFSEVLELHFNERFVRTARRHLDGTNLVFVYQRYSLNNYAGLALAQHYEVPFVLEYNGSEVWIARHWGRPFRYEELAQRIELLNLHVADVLVVVSRRMKDELVGRGVDGEKILINPNGVDPQVYFPEVDGRHVRARHGLEDKTVIGFIGTFGKWHGAEVLAEAFGRLLGTYPEYRKRLRLLLIGDGPTMPQVKRIIRNYAMTDVCVLTGLVPQERGPHYLAAADILASPHIPNPDGTPFFGSPTKLFEYMAMGKGIVASDLDQIGEVLEHDRTAWMVRPGDAGALVQGLKTLADDPGLRERLGRAARAEAVAKYTWVKHTARIIERLKVLYTEQPSNYS